MNTNDNFARQPYAVHMLVYKYGQDYGMPDKKVELVTGMQTAIDLVEHKRSIGVCAWMVALPA